MWTFGTATTVVLWQHNPTSALSKDLSPNVKVVKPAPGEVLSGHQYLVASLAGRLNIPVHVTTVEFQVSGGGFHDVPVGTGSWFGYGYLGGWNTSQFPDGRYIVTCLVVADGKSVRSRGVAVQVKH